MNVNNNVITYNAPTKVDTPKQPARKEEFKKALDDETLKSKSFSNDDVNKTNNKEENLDETKIKNSDETNNKNQKGNVGKTTAEGDTTKGLDDVATGDKSVDPLKQNIKELPKDSVEGVDIKINNTLKKIIDLLKQNIKSTSVESASADKSIDQMAQIQQLLQSLTVMIQSTDKTTTTKTSGTELISINLEELVGTKKLTPETKSNLKNKLSEILSLLENPKGNTKMSSEMIGMIQKLTTQVKDIKSDLNLLKVPTPETNSDNSEDKSIKDNLIKMLKSQNTKSTSESISKNQNQSLSDNKKDNKSSGNSSSEEKFLNKLLSGDKDDVKISKAVNFMNQFQTVKTSAVSKVISANLVIDKNNFEADVIKSVKFMEVNNIKDLTVKMNPRELGEITIKLTMESGIMKASILAQNKETYNLLNNNILDIQDRLKNMDIKIQSLDINVYEDSTFFNKNSSGNNNNNNGKQGNNSKTNVDIDDDVAISSNYVKEDNQVNKFV
ncbi:flagellar hook-length control protein FliK [Clostridium estertheticum]|uniref:flagellar hook-length control protein FliK n=1 Tax=Clostridium estertheticum TaxID=238834 RepID=UPI001C7DC3A9|nr:flagellar hook-length control protein FliK [Clostridium estertheticum]MBX4259205.1 flagellar hook-length control protein FliK [Clostridium estertheticum]WLC68888.1 flagellar hook-length control protein FliK [Clostridium estertheticum]